MNKNALLNKVPYAIPPLKARNTVSRLVSTNTIKVYQLSPVFWTVTRSGTGQYRIQMGTVLGVGDEGHEVTASAAAKFISHTAHQKLLLAQIRELEWVDLAEELERKII